MSSSALNVTQPVEPRVTVALALFAVALLTIGGAWIFQELGYLPCDLCLEQRYAYYVGVPLSLVAVGLARRPGPAPAFVFAVLALIFAANVVLAVYHSGVELKFWQGPTACTGGALSGDAGDLLTEIDKVKVVRCDDVGLRVFGLTLANWNIFISLLLAVLAAEGVVLSLRSRSAS